MMNNTNLFSDRAADYSEGRPTYSEALLDYLYGEVGFRSDSIIADIGAGTGIFAGQMAKRGGHIICVEPNRDMRLMAERNLKEYSYVQILDGTADNTGIADKSADFITAAQAFHWFDIDKFKAESARILKPCGIVVLLWNTRNTECDMCIENARVFKTYCPRFMGFSGGIRRDDERIIKYFSGKYRTYEYDNPLVFDKEKFIKRSLSASYSLREGDKQYDRFVNALEDLFDKYSVNGILNMPNRTIAYIGRIEA